MKPETAAFPFRLGALALAAALSGCTITSSDGLFSSDKIDYRGAVVKKEALEVPPDLTQLARESRYQPQGGVVSAAAAGAAAAAPQAAAAPGAPTVALADRGPLRVERQGQQRWLVVPQAPEQLWPQIKAFWEQRGFALATEDAQTGVMETAWAENRAKLPQDAIRGALGRFLGNVYDSGERDSFRTRVERTPAGSEVYIVHRGLEEVYVGERKESTAWRARPNDPQLEAEMLTRLMLALAPKEEPARAAAAVASAPDAPQRARAAVAAPGTPTTLVVEEPFDRAWRRVGLALDRGSFSVEDRDRTAGLYYVRYVDPKNAGKEEPGFWARLFGDKTNPLAALRYRVAVKAAADGKSSTVSVQNSAGQPETGENAQRIMALLTNELR